MPIYLAVLRNPSKSDPYTDADDFQNLIGSSLSKDFVVKFFMKIRSVYSV